MNADANSISKMFLKKVLADTEQNMLHFCSLSPPPHPPNPLQEEKPPAFLQFECSLVLTELIFHKCFADVNIIRLMSIIIPLPSFPFKHCDSLQQCSVCTAGRKQLYTISETLQPML